MLASRRLELCCVYTATLPFNFATERLSRRARICRNSRRRLGFTTCSIRGWASSWLTACRLEWNRGALRRPRRVLRGANGSTTNSETSPPRGRGAPRRYVNRSRWPFGRTRTCRRRRTLSSPVRSHPESVGGGLALCPDRGLPLRTCLLRRGPCVRLSRTPHFASQRPGPQRTPAMTENTQVLALDSGPLRPGKRVWRSARFSVNAQFLRVHSHKARTTLLRASQRTIARQARGIDDTELQTPGASWHRARIQQLP